MTEQTVAAVYDTAAHAEAAVRDLKAAQVPSNAISVHAQDTAAGATTAAAPHREPGFWAKMFGGESSDSDVYGRSIESGSTVVTVKTVPEHDVARVSDILERHNPIDFDERAASYGTTETTTTTTTATPAAPIAMPAAPAAAPRAEARPVAAARDGDTIQLAEEQLSIGKRAVNRGTTRIRRYVVETPVEEQVSLHSERVQVERHRLSDGRAVTAADFADKTIEMTESSEEAVVGKTARVVEEISLHKEGVDRTETVRDTVRREEVEIEEVPSVETVTTTDRTATTRPATPASRATKV